MKPLNFPNIVLFKTASSFVGRNNDAFMSSGVEEDIPGELETFVFAEVLVDPFDEDPNFIKGLDLK